VKRGLHCLLCVLCAGLLMNANHLSGARGIYGADLAFGFDALTADGQVILAAQLDSDRGQRGLHLARVFRCLEVGKWFIHKPALGEHG